MCLETNYLWYADAFKKFWSLHEDWPHCVRTTYFRRPISRWASSRTLNWISSSTAFLIVTCLFIRHKLTLLLKSNTKHPILQNNFVFNILSQTKIAVCLTNFLLCPKGLLLASEKCEVLYLHQHKRKVATHVYTWIGCFTCWRKPEWIQIMWKSFAQLDDLQKHIRKNFFQTIPEPSVTPGIVSQI